MIEVPDLIEEARTWIGTPYHLNQCLKGVGVDCGRLLVGVYKDMDLATEKTDVISADWFCHLSDDRYKLRILRHAKEIAETVAYASAKISSGCIILLRTSGMRVYSHAAIVTVWPRIVHAIMPCVEEVATFRSPFWMNKQVLVLDPWPVYEARQ